MGISLVAGRAANTVEDLFETLSSEKCWSYLNTKLLERIITNHCSESVDAHKVEYLEKLQHFRKTTTARLFAKVNQESNLLANFYEVVFEMEKDWDNATLEDVESLNREFQEQGFLRDHMLRFSQSPNTSSSLVGTFPCSCPLSNTILHIPPSFYLEHGIRRVLVKGVCVIDVKVMDIMDSYV